PEQAGLASGMVNTSFMLGGAIGLAVLAGVAAARTSIALAAGTPTLVALTDGYHAALTVGAAFAIVAAILGVTVLRTPAQDVAAEEAAVSLATAADSVKERFSD